MNEFEERVREARKDLICEGLDSLQINLGLMCNQACAHCHLEAGPDRTEMMSPEMMDRVVEVARMARPRMVDLTGGAPEAHPDFRRFVPALRSEGQSVQVRTNLTILTEPDQVDTPEFFRDQKVALVASMPCYLEENVRSQRGAGVYEKSVEALKRLNAVGFGIEEDMPLNLVYNPGGPALPPPQESLEADYHRELRERHGVEFTRLLTITNMPIGRFWRDLGKSGAHDYMTMLKEAFNEKTVDGLMCRRQVSIAWDGRLYDCDFNIALGMPVNHGAPSKLSEFDLEKLSRRQIVTAEHCFGCSAGSGSSCGGALA